MSALALIGESLSQAMPALAAATGWLASAPAWIVTSSATPGVTVESLSLASAGLAFVAGLLSFLSPCVLPLLPVYLSFVSGMGVDELATGRRRLLGVSLLFVAGFTAVFVALGAGAGGVGSLLTDYRRELEVIAGAFVAVSGLAVAGLISLPERGVGLSPRLRGPAGAVLTGAALAVAWTPCVGYVLGAILSMAASSQSAFDGALLLLMYSLGLGVPFVAAALAFGWVSARLDVVKRHYATVRVVAGAIMVVAGLLMMLGVFSRLSGWLPAFDLGGF